MLPGERLIRVFEQLEATRGLPGILRTDNGPEFLGIQFTEWCEAHGIFIDYIEPGKPNQNAYVERFNRSYRNEVLDAWLFENLDEVREMTWRWMIEYNERRPHDSLNDLTPVEYMEKNAENSTYKLSA